MTLIYKIVITLQLNHYCLNMIILFKIMNLSQIVKHIFKMIFAKYVSIKVNRNLLHQLVIIIFV